MTIHENRENRDSIFHERINILKQTGYRGFSISGSKKKWDGVEVSVINKEGKLLKGEGETPDEAYQNVIEQIDYMTDDIK